MTLQVIGAGVGRTGTHSLKLALEQLTGGRCHHMLEVMQHPEEIPSWIDAIDGKPVDWAALMSPYTCQVDWPGASFWPELLEANPDALVLLSTRDPEEWYRSASNTIFVTIGGGAGERGPWMDSLLRLMRDRFSDKIDDPEAMIAAYIRHNDQVRSAVPADQLLEWTATQGWQPICERLGLPVPDAPFPLTNTTDEFRARFTSNA